MAGAANRTLTKEKSSCTFCVENSKSGSTTRSISGLRPATACILKAQLRIAGKIPAGRRLGCWGSTRRQHSSFGEVSDGEYCISFRRPLMNNRFIARGVLVVAAFLIVAATTFAQSAKERVTDLIVVHGKVYTVNAKYPWAQAVAVGGGKIIAVGDDADIDKL